MLNKAYYNDQCIGSVEYGKLQLEFCPACRVKNWSGSISTGQCGWCNFKPEKYDIRSPSVGNKKTNRSKLFGPAARKRRIQSKQNRRNTL